MRTYTIAACILLAGSLSIYAQDPQNRPVSNAPVAQQQPAPQQAAPAAASPQIDPQEEADIRRLLELTGAAALSMQAFHSNEENLRGLMTNALPPGAYREKLITLFLQKFNSKISVQSIYNVIIPIYERHFTDADIKNAIRFYQTPVGQKYVTAMPKILAEINAASAPWGEKLGRESMLEVLSEHPELKKALEEAGKKEQQQ